MRKLKKDDLTLNLITRLYNIYVKEIYYNEGCFTDFELILLIKLILNLRDTSDLEMISC